MFKHQKIMLITALVLTSFGGPTTAHAATWHKGTPKAIRGHWIFKKNKMIFGYYYVRAHQICFQNNQSMPGRERQITYKSLGHGKYKLRAMCGYLDTTFGQNIQYSYVLKRHGKIKVTSNITQSPQPLIRRYHRGSYTSLNSRHSHMARPFS